MNIAIILSGGMGTRLDSEIPKQYIKVNGKPIIGYCMNQIFRHPMIDGVQIVAEDIWTELIMSQIEADRFSNVDTGDKEFEFSFKDKFLGFSRPGINRQLSILNALEDIAVNEGIHTHIKDNQIVVLIHDAARPRVKAQLISDCLEQIKGHDGVMPVLPMKDTVYISQDGKAVNSLLNRSQVFAGQAPEAFVFDKYLKANRALLPDQIQTINGSAEPAIIAGMDIIMVPGDEDNFKITTKADLEAFMNR